MAAKHNIVIEQGATFPLYVVYNDPSGSPVDLTGARVRFQIRQTVESASKLVDFDSNALGSGQSIAALGSSGVISIKLSATATSALSFQLAEWDLVVTTAGGEATRLLEGKASVSPAVTR